MNIEEQNYLNLLFKILKEGSYKEDRTGIGTYSLFGETLRFNLENNTFPLLTTKKMFLKGIVEELLFFVRGETNTKLLEEKGVNIWKGNTSREYLDKYGLHDLPEGNMGKGYGWQWRNFNGTESVKGVDQLINVIESIKKDPNSRRHIISAWNPCQLKEMSLPPCHTLYQFYVDGEYLSCQWYQRSVDFFLGLGFNIASYALLTKLIAHVTNLKPKELIFSGGDCHIYKNHVNQVVEQLRRKPYDFPTIKIAPEPKNLEDIEKLGLYNFYLENYNSHPAIKAEMAV